MFPCSQAKFVRTALEDCLEEMRMQVHKDLQVGTWSICAQDEMFDSGVWGAEHASGAGAAIPNPTDRDAGCARLVSRGAECSLDQAQLQSFAGQQQSLVEEVAGRMS